MAVISSAGASLSYIKEIDWGVTPTTTPAFQLLRFLPPENFKLDRENITSGEHTQDRNVSDLIQVSGGASGGFGFELSYGTYDDILESFMHAEWATNVLVNGATPIPLTFERKIPLDDTDTDYHRFTGMEANTFALSVRAK